MRDFLELSNLRRASILGGAVTLASVPRLSQGYMPLWIYVPAAFFAMTLVAGAVTAWGGTGGMAGAFPARARVLWGVAAAVGLGAVLAVLNALWLDPELKRALVAAGDMKRFQLQYPSSAYRRLASVLWVAGFQALFFQAGVMSFLCRLTRRWPVAVVLAVMFRGFVQHKQLASLAVDSVLPFQLVGLAGGVLACVLFARGGLIPPAVLAVVVQMRLLWE